MNTRTAAVVLVLAAAAGAAGYFAGNRKGEAQGEAKVAPQGAPADAANKPGEIKYPEGASQLSALKMEPAVEAPLPLAEPLNGKVSYDEDVTARITSPIAGRVVDLKVAAGDTVKAGQVLANIDAPDFAAALADLRKAEADQNVKRLSMERAQKLFDAEVIARKDLEAASADYAQAQAEGQRARARLKNLNPSGDGPGLALRAPVSGVVADRKVNPSQEVQPGSDPLFVVSNLSRLWVLVDLPEKHLATVTPGLPVAVTVEAYPNESFRGVVSRVGQVVNADTRRVQVRCDIPNVDGKLRPEMYARVILLTAEGKQAVRLPNNSLVTEGLYSYVFVETAPRNFVKRRVKLAVQDREYSYVSEGVAKGERVVVGGALLLQSEMASTN